MAAKLCRIRSWEVQGTPFFFPSQESHEEQVILVYIHSSNKANGPTDRVVTN